MIVFWVTLLPASTASHGNRVLKVSSTYQGSKEEWGASPSSSSPSSSCHKAQASLSTTSCHCWSMSLHLSLLLHSPLLLSRDVCVLHVSSPHKPQVLSRSGLGEAVPQAGQEPDLVDCELNQSESLWGIPKVPGQIPTRYREDLLVKWGDAERAAKWQRVGTALRSRLTRQWAFSPSVLLRKHTLGYNPVFWW